MERNICETCGKEKINNPRTGKFFCPDKCWLKNQGEAKPSYQNNFNPPQTQKREPNWDEIRKEKEQSIAWLNAINNATALSVAAINTRELTYADALTLLPKLVNEIYEIREESSERKNINL